jgi:hypothetical protein
VQKARGDFPGLARLAERRFVALVPQIYPGQRRVGKDITGVILDALFDFGNRLLYVSRHCQGIAIVAAMRTFRVEGEGLAQLTLRLSPVQI